MVHLETVPVGSVRFKYLFNKAVDHYYDKEPNQQGVPKEYALEVWFSLSEGGHALYLYDEDTGDEMFCVYSANQYSPHYLGEGVAVVAMLSTQYSTKLYRQLLKFLKSVTIEFGCSWLNVNHKTRTGVYELKFMKVV